MQAKCFTTTVQSFSTVQSFLNHIFGKLCSISYYSDIIPITSLISLNRFLYLLLEEFIQFICLNFNPVYTINQNHISENSKVLEFLPLFGQKLLIYLIQTLVMDVRQIIGLHENPHSNILPFYSSITLYSTYTDYSSIW